MTFVDSSVRCRRSAVFLLRFHALILETIDTISFIIFAVQFSCNSETLKQEILARCFRNVDLMYFAKQARFILAF